MSSDVCITGVAVLPFSQAALANLQGEAAAIDVSQRALSDADVHYSQVDQVYVAHDYRSGVHAQAVAYGLGLTGIPVFSVCDGDMSAAVALVLARQAIESGRSHCVLVLGFQDRGSGTGDLPSHLGRLLPACFTDEIALDRWRWHARAARLHHELFGTSLQSFLKVAVKARNYASRNPLALYSHPVTVEQLSCEALSYAPLSPSQCAVDSVGAAAVVMCSAAFALQHRAHTPVRMLASSMASDRNSSFDEGDCRKILGFDTSWRASRQAYEESGVLPGEISVAEVSDLSSVSELLAYEALGFTSIGSGGNFLNNEAGDQCRQMPVVNPSGGMLGCGYAPSVGALAQCSELFWQLRGQAGSRQVSGCRLALQHTLAAGVGCIVSIYSL